MKRLLLLGAFALLAAQPALAEEKEHQMNVHGAVCPACAIGLEKRFKAIDGVSKFDINFKTGIVKVCADETTKFDEKEMAQMFRDFGYFYKGEEIKDTCTI